MLSSVSVGVWGYLEKLLVVWICLQSLIGVPVDCSLPCFAEGTSLYVGVKSLCNESRKTPSGGRSEGMCLRLSLFVSLSLSLLYVRLPSKDRSEG